MEIDMKMKVGIDCIFEANLFLEVELLSTLLKALSPQASVPRTCIPLQLEMPSLDVYKPSRRIFRTPFQKANGMQWKT